MFSVVTWMLLPNQSNYIKLFFQSNWIILINILWPFLSVIRAYILQGIKCMIIAHFFYSYSPCSSLFPLFSLFLSLLFFPPNSSLFFFYFCKIYIFDFLSVVLGTAMLTSAYIGSSEPMLPLKLKRY